MLRFQQVHYDCLMVVGSTRNAGMLFDTRINYTNTVTFGPTAAFRVTATWETSEWVHLLTQDYWSKLPYIAVVIYKVNLNVSTVELRRDSRLFVDFYISLPWKTEIINLKCSKNNDSQR